MVNVLEGLYVLTFLSAVVAIVAAVQSWRARPERAEHYRRRMRWAALLALVLAVGSAALYFFLSVD